MSSNSANNVSLKTEAAFKMILNAYHCDRFGQFVPVIIINHHRDTEQIKEL